MAGPRLNAEKTLCEEFLSRYPALYDGHMLPKEDSAAESIEAHDMATEHLFICATISSNVRGNFWPAVPFVGVASLMATLGANHDACVAKMVPCGLS